MKKRYRLLTGLMAAVMALTLCACGGQVEETEQEEPVPQEEQKPVPQEEQVKRAADSELVYFPEGDEMRVPATLYEGDGYSLYIPSEGWTMETEEDDGMHVVSWEQQELSEADLEVELEIRKMQDMASAKAWLLDEEDDYQLAEDEQGIMSGMDLGDRMMLDAFFYPAEDGVYVVICQYYMEAAEGFGMLLSAMAESFAVTA